MQKILIFLIILCFTGLPQLGKQALAENAVQQKPSIRHLAPVLTPQGETFRIQMITDSDAEISKIDLWYRNKGDLKFQNIEMKKSGNRRYESDLFNTKQGVEYYIERVDTNGQHTLDGSKDKPYLFESTMPEPTVPFQFSTKNTETSLKKPFWKKTWFWVAVVSIVGGGIALAGSGGDKGEDSGTVTVN